MQSAILVFNAGSSSLKCAVYPVGGGDPLRRITIDGIGGDVPCRLNDTDLPEDANAPIEASDGASHTVAIDWLLDRLTASPELEIVAAGHRVVHGGVSFSKSVRLDAAILSELRALIPLARTHQPYNLAAIDAVAKAWPDLPQHACFDTAFHRTQPEIAQTLALPQELTDTGIRRYGFHGLSYRSIAERLPDYAGNAADGRVIVAHLGNGASLCAMVNRESQATTMGFTPLDGLVMGSRPGLLDPGVLLHLINERGMSGEALNDLLYNRSGLAGMSGRSNDMRTLLASSDTASERAVDLFIYRAVREIGSLAAAIGGLDCLVFTGGIGEHAAEIRARIVAGCGWLGAALDTDANIRGDDRISATHSRIAVYRIATDEEAVIADDVRKLMSAHVANVVEEAESE